MRRVGLALIAVFVFSVASFVQAANVNFKFFSLTEENLVDAADDVRFVLVSLENETVEFDSDEPGTTEVPDGDYKLIAEQPSTRFFGSVEVSLSDGEEDEEVGEGEENDASEEDEEVGEGEEDDASEEDGEDVGKRLFLLSENGVVELQGVHECKNGRKPCKCDEHCICRFFSHNCTDRVCLCVVDEAVGAECGCDLVESLAQCCSTETTCCLPNCNSLCAPYGCCCQCYCQCPPASFPLGFLSALAAIAAVVASTPDNGTPSFGAQALADPN